MQSLRRFECIAAQGVVLPTPPPTTPSPPPSAPYTHRAVEGTLLVPHDAAVQAFLDENGLTLADLLDHTYILEALVFGHSLRTTLEVGGRVWVV